MTTAPGLRFWRWKRRSGVGCAAAEETEEHLDHFIDFWDPSTSSSDRSLREWGRMHCDRTPHLGSWCSFIVAEKAVFTGNHTSPRSWGDWPSRTARAVTESLCHVDPEPSEIRTIRYRYRAWGVLCAANRIRHRGLDIKRGHHPTPRFLLCQTSVDA